MSAPDALASQAALIQAIDRAASAADAAAVRSMADTAGVQPATTPALPLETLARYAPADVRSHLLAQFGRALERSAGPALCRHLVAVIADPTAGLPDAVTTAEALAVLLRAAPRGALHDQAGAAATLLAEQARLSTNRLCRRLDQPDFPDLRSISLDVLRLEGVRWVLGILGHKAALAALSEHGRRLSRLTLKHAAATITAFVAKPDLLALYDNVAVVSQVDNLLTVAGRLLDALADGEEERTPFVEPDDQVALSAFAAALNGLAEMLGRIALKSVGRRDVTPGLVTAPLDQLRFLRQFTARLGPSRPAEFSTLDDTLQRVTRAIALRFDEVTATSGGKVGGATDDADPLTTQARAVSRLLSALS
ncbi:hypothetical protein [Azospirillum sp. TSO35-2]|uniref:hypothetical protein n=1 Tax=Azospirillum sp. TSO35-2 TaxID=716796 RepID=UPI000D60F712|nr:hypothetical protein [Azospirillum sp. TSO35-2]PWC37564.1 hypothetical protein TSO352_08460 [Azospirillum sp. TSO35-2]